MGNHISLPVDSIVVSQQMIDLKNIVIRLMACLGVLVHNGQGNGNKVNKTWGRYHYNTTKCDDLISAEWKCQL